MAASNLSTTARLALHRAPDFAWSFEETDGFSFELTNHGLADLADERGAQDLRYTAELFCDGAFARRVAIEPLPGPIGIGEKRVIDAHLGISMIGGEYELRFGLERHANGTAEVLEVDAPSSRLLVKNQIMEAFVELINACNFKCTFCPQTTLERKQRAMDFELATKVVGDLAAMGHHHPIRVHLLGEPLLYPRDLRLRRDGARLRSEHPAAHQRIALRRQDDRGHLRQQAGSAPDLAQHA